MIISSKYELIPYSDRNHLVNTTRETTLGIRSVPAVASERRYDPLRRPPPFAVDNQPDYNKKIYNAQQRMEFSTLNQMGQLIDIYV